MTVTYETYIEDLAKFIDKHSKKYDYSVYTSPFENREYHKVYAFENCATFTEINTMEYTEVVNVQVHGITVPVEVSLIKHEYWSTDDSRSKFWYEKR